MSELTDFDQPLFKRLAHNDTGGAAGHQGGVLIPKSMDEYFPQLSGSISAAHPTVDVLIRAALFIGPLQVGMVKTRYQYQTWAGTRSPERRLTGNLGLIRDAAVAGDYLVIEKRLDDPLFFRLTLLRQGSPYFDEFVPKVVNRSSGAVDLQDTPVSEKVVLEEVAEQQRREQAPFNLFEDGAVYVEARSKKLARSRAFKQRVSTLYDMRCVVCGCSHATRDGSTEVEAAHIVPRSLKGVDDARNGLALCRSHHWAFDRGLFGIGANGLVLVRATALAEPRNAHLAHFQQTPIRAPSDVIYSPAKEALAWHLANVVNV